MDEEINIEFRILGKRDGSWAIQAFNSSGQSISKIVLVRSVDEAWKLWMLLNGYPVPLNDDLETGEMEKVA